MTKLLGQNPTYGLDKEGTCVKVLPNAVRTIEAKTDLEYICVQAKSNSLEQFGLGDAELC